MSNRVIINKEIYMQNRKKISNICRALAVSSIALSVMQSSPAYAVAGTLTSPSAGTLFIANGLATITANGAGQTPNAIKIQVYDPNGLCYDSALVSTYGSNGVPFGAVVAVNWSNSAVHVLPTSSVAGVCGNSLGTSNATGLGAISKVVITTLANSYQNTVSGTTTTYKWLYTTSAVTDGPSGTTNSVITTSADVGKNIFYLYPPQPATWTAPPATLSYQNHTIVVTATVSPHDGIGSAQSTDDSGAWVVSATDSATGAAIVPSLAVFSTASGLLGTTGVPQIISSMGYKAWKIAGQFKFSDKDYYKLWKESGAAYLDATTKTN
jgi:hypothetical protein